MIKHIVMWRLKDAAQGSDKATNARLIQKKLESLRGCIPGLLAIEVGIDFAAVETSSDVVLYTEFTDRAALAHYQSHPEHKAVAALIVETYSERRMVDYEVD